MKQLSLFTNKFIVQLIFFVGRVPVRLYVWNGHEDVDDLEDAPPIDSWDKISYINQPVEIQEGKIDLYYLPKPPI